MVSLADCDPLTGRAILLSVATAMSRTGYNYWVSYEPPSEEAPDLPDDKALVMASVVEGGRPGAFRDQDGVASSVYVGRRATVRAMSVMRFVIFGAVGFGIGGAIGSLLITFLPGGVALLLWLLVGGASLGLALKDWRRVVVLALLGALGLLVGVFAGLALGSFFNYPTVPIAAIVGAVVGASLGVAFRDWRTILAMAVAGAVGFSVGNLAEFVRLSAPIIGTDLGEAGSIAITGTIGGASLGATLGYLERRALPEERRLRVR